MCIRDRLDLGDGPSDAEPDHFKSYRELLFPDSEQEIVGGVLVDRQVQATDGQGNPLFETDVYKRQGLFWSLPD